jgi:uncharacterized protein YukE
MNIELTVGRQATAALTVQESVTTLNEYLKDLSESVQGSAAGFKGSAAAGFGEALGSWFEAASKLGPALEQYATALATVDQEHGHNEQGQLGNYGRLIDRLGGPR